MCNMSVFLGSGSLTYPIDVDYHRFRGRRCGAVVVVVDHHSLRHNRLLRPRRPPSFLRPPRRRTVRRFLVRHSPCGSRSAAAVVSVVDFVEVCVVAGFVVDLAVGCLGNFCAQGW